MRRRVRQRAVAFIIVLVIASMLLADPVPTGRARPPLPRASERHERLLSLRMSVMVIFTVIASLTWLATVLWGSQTAASWPMLAYGVAAAVAVTWVVVPATKRPRR